MRQSQTIALLAGTLFAYPALAGGNWVNYVNETSTRLGVAGNSPALTTSDVEEKDYAWGDVDMDGDVDLVVVRKTPFTSTGKRANVLLMNEGIVDGQAINGVLVDRTSQYASASDVVGDNGFLTPTNDRDVQLVDLTGDGLLDIITATTLSDGDPTNLSHPRVYVNLGFNGDGSWRGFRYEEARIPDMSPGSSAGPRFCSVAAGDIDGDGDNDLYFGDYDSGGAQILDFNNRLLINNGSGFFTDESLLRMGKTHNYSSGGSGNYLLSAFGAASVMADMNNDGRIDVVKQTSLNAPTHVAIVYNNIDNSEGADGFFSDYDELYNIAPYFVTAGHLNNDGLLDLVEIGSATGRERVEIAMGAVAQKGYQNLALPAASNGFGGNSFIADLDNDGNQDIIITDVDVDISGCSRRMQIYRSSGGTTPGFSEQGQVIPFSMSNGTHDVAVLDLNNDGWLDLVVGRCSSTEVYMNVPPFGLAFAYPQGRPTFIQPNAPTTFDIQYSPIGGASLEPGSAAMYVSVAGGPFVSVPLADQGGDLYQGALPAVDCAEDVRFYLEGELAGGGGMFTDPSGAPASFYTAIAAEGQELAFRDEMEGDTSGWTVTNDASLTSGAFEVANPIGEIFNGVESAPSADSTAGSANVLAFVTENGTGISASANDIDGGPTILTSPVFDLEGTDGTISFDRWFSSLDSGGSHIPDFMTVEVSNDGGANWTLVPSMTTGGTNQAWENASFIFGDILTPTANSRVRFIASDSPNNSITEAGIDDFQVDRLICGDDATPCPADCAPDNGDGTFGNGVINIDDLLEVINNFGAAGGPCDSAPDNGDGTFGN
ncbi:MAG: VCBS repeat-containing protein, partial [Phycisphaerales bacterium]|nr:VCBS repeat-containing protein [Phycisphaerales bacterium]